MQTSRAEQAHNRHLCMGTSHVRPVPLMLTMQFYQPRAGHVTDGAVLAKPVSRKAVTPAKGHFLLTPLIKLIARGQKDKVTSSKLTQGAKFLAWLCDTDPTKALVHPWALGTLCNEVLNSLKYIHGHFLPRPVVMGQGAMVLN